MTEATETISTATETEQPPNETTAPMGETTEPVGETTKTDAPPTEGKARLEAWAKTAEASAAQKPEDPKPEFFTEKLPCALTDKERVDVAMRALDLRKEIDHFDVDTKDMVAERKSDRGKLVAKVGELEDTARTGRVQRDVRCAKYTSFEQNRKWRVRLDTMVQYEEQPLSGSERQRELPLEGPDDVAIEKDDEESTQPTDGSQLSLADAAQPDGGEAPPPSAPGDETTNVTDPEVLIAAAQAEAPPTVSEPPAEPTKRGRKSSKDEG